jgi:hypothetical protein
VRELIHRLYGTELSPRLAALAAEPAAAAPVGTEEAAAPEPPPPAPTGFAPGGGEPLEPLAAALEQALDAAEAALFEEPPPLDPGAPPGAGDAAPPAPPSSEEEEAGEAEAGIEEDDGEERPPPDRSAPPRWGLGQAREALAAAGDRDEVVLVALRYARDFFEYAAMFAVTRDAVAGHDALGREDERERARAVAIWASDPGIFKTVIEAKSPYLGPVGREAAGTEAIISGLGRGAPRAVLLHPVLLRDRTVCVLYADNGEAPVSPRRLGDLLLFLSGVGAAFERIIRDRKKLRPRRRRPPPPAAPAPAEPEAEPTPPSLDASAPVQPAPAEAPEPPEPGPSAAAEPVEPPADEAPAPAAEARQRSGDITLEAALSSMSDDVDVDVDVEMDAAEGGSPEERQASPEPPAAEGVSPPAAALDALEEAFFSGAPGEAASSSPAAAPSAAPPAPPELAAPETAPPEPVAPEPAPPEPAAAAPEPAAAPPFAPPPLAPEPPPPEERISAPPPAPAPPPPSLTALADRALDPDEATAQAARDALAERRRDPGMRPAHEKLRRALLSGISARTRRAARAIGTIRDVEAVPLLIQALETSEPEAASAAADALALITLQRLGPEARKWLAWWKENRGRGRADWLFSGLTSPDRETRAAAFAELSLAAPPPVEYSPDLPPAERERLARAWAGWWSRSGHVL